MTIKTIGCIIESLVERIALLPQHVHSLAIGETKLVLYRTGENIYQIETITEGNTEVFNFSASYHDAMCELIQQARKINNKMG